jgi:hypothetical protein
MSEARKDAAIGNAGDPSTQIHSHQEDQKERLREELTDFLLEMDEESFDEERLNGILDALDEADPMPEFSDDAESLAAFHQKYAPVFASLESGSASAARVSSSHSKKRFRLLKLLPVAAVLLLLIGSVTAQAFGFGSLLEAFTRWTSQVFKVGGEAVPHAAITKRPLEEGERAAYDTLQDALDAFGLDNVPLVPQELPERFTQTEVIVYNQFGVINIFT